MKIYGNVTEPVWPAGSGSIAPSSAREDGPVQPILSVSSASGRSDLVEISDRGRSLSASSEFEPERVAELRRKVYEGAYNSLDLVDQVARRIMRSGDL